MAYRTPQNLTCFLPPNTTVSIPTAHIPAGSTGPALQPATSTDWLYGQYALYEERVLLRGLVMFVCTPISRRLCVLTLV